MNNELENKKILIVDDTILIREMLHAKLTLEGFKVIDAEDGEEGLRIALSEQPDLILLDILMPKVDGLTMMRQLRETNEWGKNVPIILLTNKSIDDKVIKEITESKPTYYLNKSSNTPNELTEKIKEWFFHPA